ncbi:hypothetical protein LAh1_22 [Aeromonas phage LAh1]|uniref:Uncharacterized protein n=1 Tax=Aeromonas phage LAh1 TaxID=2591024 RepID=A0A513ZZ56_9CAUD|nr:hypothetical protein LAh1_22 [Aeromonas phage LAh1]QDH46367.1 hypothetical protein LAh3_25 [Aeromonas phage LAh3]QDH46417.1 hypothetical protein LAh4_27 [Aeromonas phage LAh4]QDH46470.1 hypothetical protein LAh5_28 [Aeromonas phage LAh5]
MPKALHSQGLHQINPEVTMNEPATMECPASTAAARRETNCRGHPGVPCSNPSESGPGAGCAGCQSGIAGAAIHDRRRLLPSGTPA